MKNSILLLFILLSTVANAQYFAEEGATWHYSEFPVGPGTYQEYFMKFEVTGDTIISGKVCSIIHKEGKVSCLSRPDDEFVYYSNDTVYVFDPAFLEFRMLYDFNANAGDSWEIIVFGSNSATDLDTNIVTVDSTDFISINGQSLKRLYVTYTFDSELFSHEYTSEIIERIGDTYYMFNYYQDQLEICDINHSGGLRCYEDSTLGFYETGIADSCEYFEIYADIPDYEINLFSLSPNPAHDFLEIDMENGSPDAIQIIDYQGRLILKTEDKNIDVSQFKSGVYFARVLFNGTWSQQRFVKN